MDLKRHSKDRYKTLLADLVKNEDLVLEVSEDKQLLGGRLPQIVYRVITVDPSAISVEEFKKLKEQACKL